VFSSPSCGYGAGIDRLANVLRLAYFWGTALEAYRVRCLQNSTKALQYW
jgi:hypothetical protein